MATVMAISAALLDDAQGMDRPWNLSPIPVVLAADEWPGLAEGLAQRARLLELVLADLYGPQRLLLDGALPAELVSSSCEASV